MTGDTVSLRAKWAEPLGVAQAGKARPGAVPASTARLVGVVTHGKVKRAAPSPHRRHVVLAPAMRSCRIDPDDLDAAVLSVV